MWHLQSESGTIHYLFHTTNDLMEYIKNPMNAKIKYTVQFVPVWSHIPPRPPSEREEGVKFPEPLSR